MNNVSVTKPYQRRRRFSREFKAEIVAQCLETGAFVSRISLDNGLNANMVRRWISEARRAPKAPEIADFRVPDFLAQKFIDVGLNGIQLATPRGFGCTGYWRRQGQVTANRALGTSNLVSDVHDVRPLTTKLLYHVKVLSALHDSIPVRFGHLQEKIMRVGRTIYVADLRSFSSTVDTCPRSCFIM